MRLTGGGMGWSGGFPILSKEVHSIAGAGYIYFDSEKIDLDRCFCRVSILNDTQGEQQLAVTCLGDTTEDGYLYIGAIALPIKIAPYTDKIYISVPNSSFKVSVEVVEFDVNVTKTEISQSTTAGTVSHNILEIGNIENCVLTSACRYSKYRRISPIFDLQFANNDSIPAPFWTNTHDETNRNIQVMTRIINPTTVEIYTHDSSTAYTEDCYVTIREFS